MLFILKQIIKKQKKIIYYYYCFQCVSIFFYIFKDQEFLLEILSNNIYLQNAMNCIFALTTPSSVATPPPLTIIIIITKNRMKTKKKKE